MFGGEYFEQLHWMTRLFAETHDFQIGYRPALLCGEALLLVWVLENSRF